MYIVAADVTNARPQSNLEKYLKLVPVKIPKISTPVSFHLFIIVIHALKAYVTGFDSLHKTSALVVKR